MSPVDQYETNSKSVVPTSNNRASSSYGNKRKSRFKKAPQAPKRFKSAYIFFSTDMMQRIKSDQKESGKGKQKITDISKRISQSWKNLDAQERSKWLIIAKKDKERFMTEKKNYKGPWQLPVDQNTSIKGHDVTADKYSPSIQEQEPVKPPHPHGAHTHLKANPNEDTYRDFEKTSKRQYGSMSSLLSEEYFNSISQEERDAAHNLVFLNKQKTPNSNSQQTEEIALKTKQTSQHAATTRSVKKQSGNPVPPPTYFHENNDGSSHDNRYETNLPYNHGNRNGNPTPWTNQTHDGNMDSQHFNVLGCFSNSQNLPIGRSAFLGNPDYDHNTHVSNRGQYANANYNGSGSHQHRSSQFPNECNTNEFNNNFQYEKYYG